MVAHAYGVTSGRYSKRSHQAELVHVWTMLVLHRVESWFTAVRQPRVSRSGLPRKSQLQNLLRHSSRAAQHALLARLLPPALMALPHCTHILSKGTLHLHHITEVSVGVALPAARDSGNAADSPSGHGMAAPYSTADVKPHRQPP